MAYNQYYRNNNQRNCGCNNPGNAVNDTVRISVPDSSGGMVLAMAYVPKQKLCEVYDVETALVNGTLFPELDKPFLGKGGCCK